MSDNMDESHLLLAAQYIHEQLEALSREFPGIHENKDIECVHQARVASRRLRAALRIFQNCFAPKKYKKWRQEVRRLTKGLGTARDNDVAIIFLQSTLKDLTEKKLRPGIKRFLLRLAQERKAIQPKVINVVNRLDQGQILDQMFAEVGGIQFALKRRGPERKSLFLFEHARRQILNCINHIMQFQPSLANPHAIDDHHQMRIAAKRLRYTMEIYQTVFDGQLDPFIKTAKKLQTLLGNIHDCDVWIERLDTFIRKEHSRTIQYFGHTRSFHRLKPGIEYLTKERQQYRNTVFEQLKQYWQKLLERDNWDKLEQVLNEQVAQFKEPQQPSAIEASPAESQETLSLPAEDELIPPPQRPESEPAPAHPDPSDNTDSITSDNWMITAQKRTRP
ncbi:MAG: CHAD domain-containing protein [Sedimentisphaerales bacterium]|nr:CHAD domain-containing protein [Sedimentisphaerales bacterium]